MCCVCGGGTCNGGGGGDGKKKEEEEPSPPTPTPKPKPAVITEEDKFMECDTIGSDKKLNSAEFSTCFEAKC